MARLARVAVPGFPHQVAHHGNRTGMTKTEGGVSKGTTYTYDAGEQLTRFIYSEDGTAQYTKTYGYDAAGQTTRVTKAGGGLATEVKTYEWDAMGCLTKAEVSAGSTTTATYDYNPSGDRVKRLGNGATKLWSYAGHNIATAESSDNANVYSVYAVIGGGISNAVARHDVNASSNSTTSYYYQYNHRGDVVAALDSGGGYLYKYEYDAYGNVTTKWNSAGGNAPTDDILFTGKDCDPDTGLYYFNARWYDPEVGRFVSATGMIPVAEQRYSTCEDNPVNRVDQTGLLSLAGIGGEIRDIGRGIGRGIGDIGRGIGRGVGGIGRGIGRAAHWTFDTLTEYGNCCGLNKDCSAPGRQSDGTAIDKCCEKHDECLNENTPNPWLPTIPFNPFQARARADAALCCCAALAFDRGEPFNPEADDYALKVMGIFCSGLGGTGRDFPGIKPGIKIIF